MARADGGTTLQTLPIVRDWWICANPQAVVPQLGVRPLGDGVAAELIPASNRLLNSCDVCWC